MHGLKKDDNGMTMMVGFKKLAKVLISETKVKEHKRAHKEKLTKGQVNIDDISDEELRYKNVHAEKRNNLENKR